MTNASGKLRAVNIPSNTVGRLRQDLYRSAFGRIKESVEAGYMLEAITLCESVIADRMEARRAWIHNQNEGKRRFGTLGGLANDLLGTKKGSIADPAMETHSVYREIISWAVKRNGALHEMVKLSETDQSSWNDRYFGLTQVAADGMKLSRKISNLVKKLNRATRSGVTR